MWARLNGAKGVRCTDLTSTFRFNELFKGTENISDHEARNDTIANLKMMIQEWLNDNYPEMPLAERQRMAESMDMSLIDSKKAESLSTIYEINNVIRMSFIEAQFIKKVRFWKLQRTRHSTFPHISLLS